ncbi:MAG: hypothetical protein ABII85_01580 [Bacillota bacterium]
MEKTIKIGEKEYRLLSSVYAIIEYRIVFGTELFDDLEKLNEFEHKKSKNYSVLIDNIFRIIYVLHKPFCNISYKEFMMSLDFTIISDAEVLQVIFTTIGEMLVSIKSGSAPSPQFK